MLDRFYEYKAKYDRWVILALTAFFILHIILIIILAVSGIALLAWIVVGMLLLYILLCAAALPRAYKIHSDKLRIVFGGPLVWNITFTTINKVLAVHGSMARKNLGPIWCVDYWGLNLATSSKSVIEIRRDTGWGLIISPTDRSAFLKYINDAINSYRSSSGLLAKTNINSD